jgi:hypothetical protein
LWGFGKRGLEASLLPKRLFFQAVWITRFEDWVWIPSGGFGESFLERRVQTEVSPLRGCPETRRETGFRQMSICRFVRKGTRSGDRGEPLPGKQIQWEREEGGSFPWRTSRFGHPNLSIPESMESCVLQEVRKAAEAATPAADADEPEDDLDDDDDDFVVSSVRWPRHDFLLAVNIVLQGLQIELRYWLWMLLVFLCLMGDCSSLLGSRS